MKAGVTRTHQSPNGGPGRNFRKCVSVYTHTHGPQTHTHQTQAYRENTLNTHTTPPPTTHTHERTHTPTHRENTHHAATQSPLWSALPLDKCLFDRPECSRQVAHQARRGLREFRPPSSPRANSKGGDGGVESAGPFPGKPGRVDPSPSVWGSPRHGNTC